MLFLAGFAFQIEPEASLTPAEGQALRTLADSGSDRGQGARPAFRVVLDRGTVRAAAPAAARVSWTRDLCVLEHAAFRAEIDPFRKQARVFRGDASALGLVTTLRTALACWLPLEGGLVLHAAGLEHAGAGIAFFGPSGAGKTTLSGRSPWPVLSDELVAIVPGESASYRIRGTPFRKAPAGAATPGVEEPALLALIELDKGPFSLTRHDPRTALRRLIASAAVPAVPPVWSAALAVIGRLAREVPCYGMAWSLEEPPFARLASALRL